MAWRNFPIVGMEDYQGEILDFSLLNRLSYNWTMGSYAEDFTFKAIGSNGLSTNTIFFGDTTNGFKISRVDAPNYYCAAYLNGSATTFTREMFRADANQYINNGNSFTLYCCVDDETQKAYLFALTRDTYRKNPPVYNCFWADASNFMNSNYCYQLVTQYPIITYQWQSVPSISGKNGILQSLVQIKEEALNDGEPVSGATVLSFDSLGNINIPSVIDEQMPVDPSNPTSVTITYLIPVLEYGSYSYIKVAIKKNSIPLSLEDADRVVDLDEPTTITRIGSATISGLDELSHYYFVIFIEDELGNTASSTPMDCETGEMQDIPLELMVKNADFLTDYKNTGGDFSWNGDIFQVSGMSQYRNNNYTLYTCGSYWTNPILLSYLNGIYSVDLPEYNQHSEHWGTYENVGLPLNQQKIVGINVDFRFDDVVLPLTQWSGRHIPIMRFAFYQPSETDGYIDTNFDIYDETTSTSKTVSGGYITAKELSWASGGFVIGDNEWHSLQIRFANNASYNVDFISIHQQYIPMHYKNIKFILARD